VEKEGDETGAGMRGKELPTLLQWGFWLRNSPHLAFPQGERDDEQTVKSNLFDSVKV
jgi:hypothetical protein